MTKLLPNWDTDNVESLAPFSRITLIVVDLDGTLLRPRGTQTWAKINELHSSLEHHRYSVRMTIATGRTLWGVRPLLEKLSIDGEMPIILNNGSIIIRNGSFSTIFQRTISANNLSNVLDIAGNYKVRILAYVFNDPALTAQTLLQHGPNEYMFGWATIEPVELDFNNMVIIWQPTWKNEKGLSPSSILIDISEDSKSEISLMKELNKMREVSIYSAKPKYIEIRPKNSNKGTALEQLLLSLGMDASQVLALGDDDNDAEMLSIAGIGVAIGGASTLAETHSDYICRHTVEAGAIEVLRLVRNARRYFYKS
jgi:Cof subfamily protein (haloacid dehalogenase superfamily)